MTDRKFPPWLSELDDEPLRTSQSADPQAIFERFPELLVETPPKVGSLERLMAAVTTPSLRFAPFFRRVGELYDLDTPAVEALFTRAGDPARWRSSGLPGVRVFDVDGGPRVSGAEAVLVRFAPGKHFPKHQHSGAERLLLLEGGYEDDQGAQYHAGDEHRMAEGTTHSFRIFEDGPCIGAALYGGRLVFSSLGLRLLGRILGR